MINNCIENIGIISHNYNHDTPKHQLLMPYYINCRNYSSLLINSKLLNNYDIKWRLKYNEDVDLTIQCITKGIKTISTNFFLSGKKPTKTCKGGNTDTIYNNLKNTDDKFKDKFDCLYNTWKTNELVEPCIIINIMIKEHIIK